MQLLQVLSRPCCSVSLCAESLSRWQGPRAGDRTALSALPVCEGEWKNPICIPNKIKFSWGMEICVSTKRGAILQKGINFSLIGRQPP